MSNRVKNTIAGLQEALDYNEGKQTNVRSIDISRTEIDVKSLRERLGLSQEGFAERYGLPLPTIRNWEQGRRQPEGPAVVLLTLISKEPEQINQILHA